MCVFSFMVSKCGSSERNFALLVMAVAAIMQSPIGMFLCRHFSSAASFAMFWFRFWICSLLLISDRWRVSASFFSLFFRR